MTTVIRGTDDSASTPALTGTDADTGVFFPAANTMAMSTGGAEAMRIDSSGRLLIGTSTSNITNGLLQVGKASGGLDIEVKTTLANGQSVNITANNNNSRSGVLGVFKHVGITNSAAYLLLQEEDLGNAFYWTGNDGNFRISTDANNIGTNGGTVVGTQSSDERLKNISGVVPYGLNEILALEPIAFAFKDRPDFQKIGFSAQQVQLIVPEAVYDTGECIDGYDADSKNTMLQTPKSDRTKLVMEYTQLIPVLVNAIKELSTKNTALEARIAALEAQ